MSSLVWLMPMAARSRVQESLTDRFANLLKLQDDLARRFAAALHQSPARSALRTRTLVVGGVSVRGRSQRPLSGRPLSRRHRAAAEFRQAGRHDTPRRGRCSARVTRGSRQARRSTAEQRSELQSQALTASLRAVEINPTLYEAQVSLALAYRALEQIRAAAARPRNARSI